MIGAYNLVGFEDLGISEPDIGLCSGPYRRALRGGRLKPDRTTNRRYLRERYRGYKRRENEKWKDHMKYEIRRCNIEEPGKIRSLFRLGRDKVFLSYIYLIILMLLGYPMAVYDQKKETKMYTT